MILHNPRVCANNHTMTLQLRDKGDRWKCRSRDFEERYTIDLYGYTKEVWLYLITESIEKERKWTCFSLNSEKTQRRLCERE